MLVSLVLVNKKSLSMPNKNMERLFFKLSTLTPDFKDLNVVDPNGSFCEHKV
jgi:hypothetical protein